MVGDDHALTRDLARDLAFILTELGGCKQARELREDALARSRRVLGDDHPDTLKAASNLANTLHVMREHEQARELREATDT